MIKKVMRVINENNICMFIFKKEKVDEVIFNNIFYLFENILNIIILIYN